MNSGLAIVFGEYAGIDCYEVIGAITKQQLSRPDIDAFGGNIGEVWELNKTLDPGTSNEQIEGILSRIGDLICGAKLLGAGGGGFLLMVTEGIEEARKVKLILTDEAPNDRA